MPNSDSVAIRNLALVRFCLSAGVIAQHLGSWSAGADELPPPPNQPAPGQPTPGSPPPGRPPFAAAPLPTNVQPFRLGEYEFFERQYVFASPNAVSVNGVNNSLAFEAQVGPHVPLVGGQFGGDDPIARPNTELRFIFTFQSDFRMVTSESAPILTPSYMPRFRLQALRRRVGVAPGTRIPVSDWRYGFTLDVWSHHSNGQDGCTYLPLPTSATTDCTGHDQATGLNERNGSFSTNYFGLTWHTRYSWDPTAGGSLAKKYDARTFSVLGSAGFQVHHNVPGAGLPDDMRALWGVVHGSIEAEGRWNPRNDLENWLGYFYLRGRLDGASGGEDPQFPSMRVRNARYTGEIGWICTKLLGLGLFARVVAGREYYNIQFTQDATRIQLGVTIDTTGQAGALNVRSSVSGAALPGDTVPQPGSPPLSRAPFAPSAPLSPAPFAPSAPLSRALFAPSKPLSPHP